MTERPMDQLVQPSFDNFYSFDTSGGTSRELLSYTFDSGKDLITAAQNAPPTIDSKSWDVSIEELFYSESYSLKVRSKETEELKIDNEDVINVAVHSSIAVETNVLESHFYWKDRMIDCDVGLDHHFVASKKQGTDFILEIDDNRNDDILDNTLTDELYSAKVISAATSEKSDITINLVSTSLKSFQDDILARCLDKTFERTSKKTKDISSLSLISDEKKSKGSTLKLPDEILNMAYAMMLLETKEMEELSLPSKVDTSDRTSDTNKVFVYPNTSVSNNEEMKADETKFKLPDDILDLSHAMILLAEKETLEREIKKIENEFLSRRIGISGVKYSRNELVSDSNVNEKQPHVESDPVRKNTKNDMLPPEILRFAYARTLQERIEELDRILRTMVDHVESVRDHDMHDFEVSDQHIKATSISRSMPTHSLPNNIVHHDSGFHCIVAVDTSSGSPESAMSDDVESIVEQNTNMRMKKTNLNTNDELGAHDFHDFEKYTRHLKNMSINGSVSTYSLDNNHVQHNSRCDHQVVMDTFSDSPTCVIIDDLETKVMNDRLTKHDGQLRMFELEQYKQSTNNLLAERGRQHGLIPKIPIIKDE